MNDINDSLEEKKIPPQELESVSGGNFIGHSCPFLFTAGCPVFDGKTQSEIDKCSHIPSNYFCAQGVLITAD